MTDSEEVRELMAKLMAAVEASLSGSTAVRDALAELARNGYEPRLYFVANAETADEGDEDDADEARDGAEGPEAETAPEPILREWTSPVGSDLSAELTKLDRDFLRSVRIRTEPGA
jgi:hypothetical protein